MNFEDPQFVERIRRCESEALRGVVESYLPHILNTARASGLAPERAEDVTQATFVTFLERASEFEGRSHVRIWLFGILYRKISEARRGLNRERRSDAIFESGGEIVAQSPAQPGLYAKILAMTS